MPRDLIAATAAALVPVIANVATDPRKLKPGEVCRLLNSTPQGAVLDDRKLRGHRTRAGSRIGDGRTIDLVRYAGWLAAERYREPPPVAAVSRETGAAAAEAYERKKERERQRNAVASARDREVGELPPPADIARREACRLDVVRWCDTYLPHWFHLGWPPDLKEVAEHGARVILQGGQQPTAMPRGGGKSTIAKALILWASLEGHRRFSVLVGANKSLADELLDDIKFELLTNDRLLEDYPETCVPVRNVGDVANRCKGQTHAGEPTFIHWGKDRIVFPRIEGSPAAGVILVSKGLTGGLRGLNCKGVRPDLVLLDDVQTDDSARSAKQIRRRLKIIKGAVRGLAGPGKEVSLFAMVTIIQPGDVADQLLDPTLNPEWQGTRYKLLYRFPADMELWRQYYDIRRAALVAGARGVDRWKACNAFYRRNRKAMDAGASVAWEARKLPAQLSALQFAMDLYFEDESVFLAEYQQTPKRDDQGDTTELTVADIVTKTTGLPAAIVPLHAVLVTAFVDVQHDLFYWCVSAWRDDFAGGPIDYGAWPEQRREYFTASDADPRLGTAYPGCRSQAAVKQGLTDLARHLRGRVWRRETGSDGALPIDLCLVDWGDGAMTAEIAEVCRLPEFHGWLIPARGKGITPDKAPMHEYRIKPGEKLGHHWHYKHSKFGVKGVDVDTNYWKSFVADALASPFGNRGAITFFGGPGKRHEMFAEHCTSETRSRVKNVKTGRTVDVWNAKPGRPDNHLWDCLVGCTVGASLKGLTTRDKSLPPHTSRASPGSAPAAQRVRPLF